MRKELVALEWSEEDVALMASDPSTDRGLVWWESYGSRRYTNLPLALDLDDNEEEPEVRPGSKVQKELLAAGTLLLWWRGRYRTMGGSVVSRPRIWDATRRAVSVSASDMNSLCGQLKSGAISLRSWQLEMSDRIIASHVGAAMIAAGGQDALAPDVMAYVEKQIEFQLSRLTQLSSRIAGGVQRVDGTVCRLMRMYGNSANATFWGTDNIVVANKGFTMYQNELGANEDHCTSGLTCSSVTEMGLAPVGTLAPIGSRACMSNCLCTWRYYNPSTDEWW